ncbi:glycosyltransferase [Bradyrhizobium sp. CB82]|uniref:glycosyltransferase n=1 Tax=Bradyrhizobium sp. CB82 TaxID=3039159 RepID=UPI0024B0D702|nr:glycosyltransferase [Bradyrhizobium sp. CB82]WFU38835.1 glycosyltransferase [Bradyrhizobium sp. CB82]
MRIMFMINGLVPGGAELHTLQLANSLATHGHVCTMVSLTGGDPTLLRQNPAEICHGNRIYDIGTLLNVTRLIRAHSPQLMVAIDERPLLFATVSRHLAKSNAKLVAILHKAYLRTIRERVFDPIYRYVAARADALVYVSQNQRKLWEDRGFTPPRSIVIRNGVDQRRFSPRSVIEWRDRTRSLLGFTPDDYVIGMCARFSPEKNHCQLIDAMQVLRTQGRQVKALLVGSGPTQATVAQYARESGLSEHIVFAGHQLDVCPYTSAFDVGVLCSLYEAAPLSVLEMMAMGLPVVVSNVGGLPEIVRPGETGFLFPVGDTVALVNSIEMMSDPLKRESFGRAASKLVTANFGVDRMLESYSTFLSGLL